MTLVEAAPTADWYFLQEGDTMVFPVSFGQLLNKLTPQRMDDLFMGHATEADQMVNRFVQAGGGVLILGQTLRRLNTKGNMPFCLERSIHGEWCWHHMDWVLADCMRAIGIEA